jgi:hypothetical protein
MLSLPGGSGFAALAGGLFRTAAFRSLSRHILLATMKDAFSPEPVPNEWLDRELTLFSERPEAREHDRLTARVVRAPCVRRKRDSARQRLFRSGQGGLDPPRF